MTSSEMGLKWQRQDDGPGVRLPSVTEEMLSSAGSAFAVGASLGADPGLAFGAGADAGGFLGVPPKSLVQGH